MDKKILVVLAIIFSLGTIAEAHAAFINLIGNIEVQVTPNSLSPLVNDNFTASVDFTDLNSSKALYPTYNVKIYNQTELIFEIDNLTTAPAKISSFSYSFPTEGVYFFLIEIPGQGQTDFPIYIRSQSISGWVIVVAAGIAALAGYCIGKYDLLKPLEEGIEVLEGKKKTRKS